jgi:LPS-assembly lipoprotein
MSSCRRSGGGRRTALLSLASLALAACGFQLRGQATFAFTSIYVNASTSPPFEIEMRRAVAGAGNAALADSAAGAQVVLDVSLVADEKSVLSLSSGGRVREFALAKRVVFRVYDKDGRVWLPTQEIVVRRTYLYDDSERLAREIQEARLLREMQTDAVLQIVRQLQTAKRPA